jgi:hypothetical protein
MNPRHSRELDWFMFVRFRTLLGILAAIGLAAQVHAGEFQYSVPQGWWDVLAPNPPESGRDMTNMPKAMLVEATSGHFKAYAIDPRNTTSKRPGAIFNAVEQPGSVIVTLDEVNKVAASLIEALAAAGRKATIDEYSVFKLDGVPVGMITIDVDDGREEARMLRQYLIPGKKSATVLTYAVSKAEYTSYLAVFEASARATKGASNNGYSWQRGLIVGGVGGLTFAIASIILALVRRRRDVAAQAEAAQGGEALAGTAPRASAAPAAKKASKYVWNCPACGNPVPMRLALCRCGAAKPA